MIEAKTYQDELYAKCSGCGFCYECCPVYSVTGTETDVSHAGQTRFNHELAENCEFLNWGNMLSSCLLCKACFPSCFSGTTPDEYVRRAREAAGPSHGLGLLKGMLMKAILPYPKRMAFIVRVGSLLKKTGLVHLAKMLKITACGLRIVDTIPVPAPKFHENVTVSDDGSVINSRESVTYFQSCGFNHFVPEVRMNSINILRSLGYHVVFMKNICCGLPPYAEGDTKSAKEMAMRNILLLEGSQMILTECGSCSSFLKRYPELLADEPQYSEMAKKFTMRINDTLEFVFSNISNLTPHFADTAPQHLKVT